MTNPRSAYNHVRDLTIVVPEILLENCGVLGGAVEPIKYRSRLNRAGFLSMADIHMLTVGDLLTKVPTTPKNIEKNILSLWECGIEFLYEGSFIDVREYLEGQSHSFEL